MHKTVYIAAALLALTGCGSGRSPMDRGDRDGGIAIADMEGRISIIKPGPDANAAYTEALDLIAKGDCPNAVTKLRPVANLGPGYENAQTALGSCLIKDVANDAELSADYLEGLTWLRRAGDAGWPEAQGALAVAHATGPAAIRNGEEAAYWLALYETNPRQARIGFIPLPQDDLAAIDKSLSETDRKTGATRARAWVRKVWLPPPAAGNNGPGMERKPGGRERRGPSSLE